MYSPGLANTLLPPAPLSFDPATFMLESLYRDDIGQPNGNTPSYTVLMGTTTGPMSGPITPRAFFTASQDVNDDNLGLWLHQNPAALIPQGSSGRIAYTVLATTDPFPAPQLTLSLNQPSFRPGQTLRMGLRARNIGPAFLADFYFGFLLPDGVTVLFVTSLSPLNGVLTRLDADPRTFQPLLVNVQLPQSLDITLPNFFAYTFAGGESAGTYAAFAFFTPPGAFRDGQLDPCDIIEINIQPLIFNP
jgi:hypothetical protein